MTMIDMAERKSRWRAFAFYFFAAMILATLWLSMGPSGSAAIDGDGLDFFRGLWFGITAASAVNLMPIGRWLKPNSRVARLLDDEGTREHRRTGCTAGFWAAIVAALAVSLVVHDGPALNPFDTARVIATAAMIAALVSFATLELRAQGSGER